MAKSNSFLEILGAVAAIATIGGFLIEVSAKKCPYCDRKVRITNGYYCKNCQIHVSN